MNRPKVSEATTQHAKAFVESLRADLDEKPGGDIVAGWSKSGMLLVCCRGRKANTLDSLLRDNGLAQPDNRNKVEAPA